MLPSSVSKMHYCLMFLHLLLLNGMITAATWLLLLLLQIGLCNVNDLSPISRLPKIQVDYAGRRGRGEENMFQYNCIIVS